MNIIFQEFVLFILNTLISCTGCVLTLKIKNRLLFLSVVSLSISTLNILLRFIFNFPSYFYSPIIIVFFFLLLLAFSQSSKKMTTLFFVINFLIMAFSEYLSASLVLLLLNSDALYTYELVTENSLIFRTTYYVIYVVGISNFIIVWRRFYSLEPAQDTFIFYGLLPMLLSQLGFLSIMVELLEGIRRPVIWYIQIFGAGILFAAAQVAMVVLIRFQQKSLQEQNRQTTLLRAVETQFDQFQQMMLQEKSRAKFRHDLNNQLQTISLLYKNGNPEEALNHLQELLHMTELQNSHSYCINPTINAVLSLKMEICKAENIRLDSDISLPLTFSLNEMVVCSVFANILDNAIQSCKISQKTDPKICLNVGYQAGFLLIRCENTASKTTLSNSGRNHWGLEILSDIAKQYNGYLQTSKENDKFVLALALQTN